MNHRIDRHQWLVILSSVLGVAVSVIPVWIISFSVFIKPLGQTFGWGRGSISLTLLAIALAMAAAMPVAGSMIDRLGTRTPMLASLVLLSFGLAASPWIITHAGIAGLYAAAIFAGIVGSPSSSVAYVKILSAQFDAHRGLALGFAMTGIALGGATVPLAAASLIARYGWQSGFFAMAALPLVVGLPIALWLPHTSRTTAAKREWSSTAGEILVGGTGVHEAVRNPTFLLLVVIFLLDAMSVHGVQLHVAPLLSDRGLSPQASAAGLSYLFAISALTRLLSGYLFDRVFAPRVGAACFAASTVGMLLLIAPVVSATTMLGVALIGVGAGAESDLLGYLVSRYYGLHAFGQIYGWVFAGYLVGSALGPYLIGVAFDALNGYGRALAVSAATLGIVTLLLLVLPRFRASDSGLPTNV